MLKKILSSIGIGSARVDLVLPGYRYRAGERIDGILQVTGGNTDQLVNQVYLQLVVDSKIKKDEGTKTISQTLDQAVLTGEFAIAAGDPPREIPVSYVLPENIPVSTSSTRLYLVTGLDISSAVDPKDHDPVEILPGLRQEVIMRALEQELGFIKKHGTGAYNGRYQEFEYRPGGFMRGKLDEIEVVFHTRPDGIGMLMEIDKRTGGLFGGFLDELNLDERNVSCFLSNAQITNSRDVASVLAGFIDAEYRKII